jgi:hypothetical protein
MRELLFKNVTTWEQNKRDIFVQEVVEKDGVLAKTTRRCLYFIKARKHIKNPKDLKKLAEIKLSDNQTKRHFHVLKERDSDQGVDKLMCKVAGTFYAMIDEYLYSIVFVHTFKISFCAIEEDKE